MTDKLSQLLRAHAVELIDANAQNIADELKTAEEGKLPVSLTFKLVLIGLKLHVKTGIGFTRRFSDETEGSVEIQDPKQPELAGVSGVVKKFVKNMEKTLGPGSSCTISALGTTAVIDGKP
jgi:hypothetical protein